MSAQHKRWKANPDEWLEALKRHDPMACRSLVQEYLPSLFAFFQGMGCAPAEAEDLAQETFVELWRSFERYRGDASLKTWVFLLGRRVAWKHFRKHKHDQLVDDDTNTPNDDQVTAPVQEEWVWIQERDEALHACIETLVPKHREVLLLHYMEELSIQELAGVLELAEGTAKSRLHRALKLLRTEVQRVYHPSS